MMKFAEAIGAPLSNGNEWANTSLIQSDPLHYDICIPYEAVPQRKEICLHYWDVSGVSFLSPKWLQTSKPITELINFTNSDTNNSLCILQPPSLSRGDIEKS